MHYKDLSSLSSPKFKRLTSVKREVFDLMLEVIESSKSATRKHSIRCIPSRLSIADKLLMLLIYYLEYRTLFHIGITYGISESRTCEIIQELESILIRGPRFYLLGKKSLVSSESIIEVVLVDVTESPFERPKKTAAKLLR